METTRLALVESCEMAKGRMVNRTFRNANPETVNSHNSKIVTATHVSPEKDEGFSDFGPYQHSERPQTTTQSILSDIHVTISIVILFLNYFLAQYDKFILSYFQDPFTADLSLSATQYAVLSGYATGIVYAFLALPIAYVADYLPRARVWTLTIAALWWSLCVVFQSISHNYWQVLLARIGMGVGQAAVAPLSISLISDMRSDSTNLGKQDAFPLRRLLAIFVGASFFYVGVYIGEAVSGQIATAFVDTASGWRIALRAIGITGLVLALVLRLVLREPSRKISLVEDEYLVQAEYVDTTATSGFGGKRVGITKFEAARIQLKTTVSYVTRLRSFWLIVLSASFRQ